ncbi:hypothetical protein, partial [Microbacterium sp. 2MCAF23]|uniref:hypothetical protein n=1 Tax=Microbacterium sp. 2MCAF23 TaxID=3232985 RepID=UPI003F9AF52A
VRAERAGTAPEPAEEPDRGGAQAMRAAHAAVIRAAAGSDGPTDGPPDPAAASRRAAEGGA